MTPAKRALDLMLALMLALILALPFGLLLLVLWVREGRPVFYVAERMRAPGRPFLLWKLRTMSVVPPEAGVSGGTCTGERWRRWRRRLTNQT
jgi:lipopolysaccharide/colanic/teichoic acid biosynthesis glycosyltransferase